MLHKTINSIYIAIIKHSRFDLDMASQSISPILQMGNDRISNVGKYINTITTNTMDFPKWGK